MSFLKSLLGYTKLDPEKKGQYKGTIESTKHSRRNPNIREES
jgi:hypothetical protein